MPGYETKQPIGQMNITPLTGVMLILLVVLMATATVFTPQPHPSVDLPVAVTSRTSGTEVGETVVAIDGEGDIFIEEQPVSDEEFGAALLAASQEKGGDVVMIRADAQAPYGRVLWVMDSARLQGLLNVALVTVRPPEEEN